jgi:hypothetical protein
MLTLPLLVQQMMEFAMADGEDRLPERWKTKLQVWQENLTSQDDDEKWTLREWLEGVYFDQRGRGDSEFTAEDVVKVAELTRRMLRFESWQRVTAKDVLDDGWFQ